MEFSPIVLFAAALLPAISACYLYLGRRLTLGRRLFASLHGLLALAIAPAGIFVDTKLAGTALEGGVAMATVAFVAIASVVYSILALPQRWPAHLLHVLTTAIIGIGILAGGLYCCGH